MRFVPRIKLPDEAMFALPAIVAVAFTTVFNEVTLRLPEPVKVRDSKKLTSPALIVKDPPNETVFLKETVPVLPLAPMFSVFEADEAMA